MIEFKVEGLSQFIADLKKFDIKVRNEILEEGIAKAGMNLLNDAIMERPTVPLKTGFLRGSGSVIVQGECKLTSETLSKHKGKPNKDFDNKEMHYIVATVGFNTPYAARLHENPDFRFTHEDSGAKYLEAKMIKNKIMYIQEVVDIIYRFFKKGK